MGTKGAALATVGAQFISVVISCILISHKTLPFKLEKKMITWNTRIINRILVLGIPIAVQDLLVGMSFLVILAIVNSIGLVASTTANYLFKLPYILSFIQTTEVFPE